MDKSSQFRVLPIVEFLISVPRKAGRVGLLLCRNCPLQCGLHSGDIHALTTPALDHRKDHQMTNPKAQTEKGPVLLNRARQAKYQAKLDAMSPLQVLRWKLERHDPAGVDKWAIYTADEEKQLEALKDLIAAAEVIASSINRSVQTRLEKAPMTPEVGAMLVELKTKTVRYTLPSY